MLKNNLFHGDFFSLICLLCVLLAVLFCLIRILQTWRTGIIYVFVLLYLEDSIRKLAPGGANWVMVVKDAVIFFTYISIFFCEFVKSNGEKFRPLILGVIGIWASWIAISLIGTNPNLKVSLALFRTYLFYIPLCYAGYKIFSSVTQINQFLSNLALLSIPCLMVAIIQIIYGYEVIEENWPVRLAELFLPLSGGHKAHSHDFEVIPVAVSFFAGPGRLGSHSMIFFFLSLGLYLSPLYNRNKLMALSMICSFGCMALAAKRVYVLIAGIAFIILIFIYIRSKAGVLRETGLYKMRQILLFLVLSSVGIVFFSGYFSDTEKSRIDMLGGVITELELRSTWFKEEFYTAISVVKWLEFRAGFFGQERLLATDMVETEVIIKSDSGIVRLLVEGGYTGLCLFMILWGVVTFKGYQSLCLMNGSPLFAIGFTLFYYQIALLMIVVKAHTSMSDAAVLIPFWFFSGLLFRMREWANMGKSCVGLESIRL